MKSLLLSIFLPEFGVDYSFDTFNEMKMLSTEIPNPSNPVDDDTISTISTISNQPSALRSARATQDNFAANAFDESVNSKINSTFDAAGEDVDGMAGSAGLAGLPIKGSGANITSRCHNVSEKCRTIFFLLLNLACFDGTFFSSFA